jgi:hypothetical protein
VITEIVVENFRSWAGESAVPLRGLTLVVGENSAGKSSLFAAVQLLRQTLASAWGASIPLRCSGPLVDTGDFVTQVYGHDRARRLQLGVSFQDASGRKRRCVAGFRHVPVEVAPSQGQLVSFELWEEGWEEPVRFAQTERGLAAYGLKERIEETPIAQRLLEQLTAADTPEQYGRALDAFVERTEFRFQGWLPYGYETSEPAPPAQSEGDEDPPEDLPPEEQLRLLREAWRGLADTFAQSLEEALDSVRHLGPIRRPFGRAVPATRAERIDDVGRHGENLPLVLLDKDVAKRVNEVIARIGMDYRVSVSTDTDDSRGTWLDLRLHHRASGITVNPQDVGQGIAQSLPCIAQVLARPRLTTILEQPELHLNPRLQVGVAQLLADVASSEQGTQVIIETHSEEVVDRVLRCLRCGQVSDISILYIHRPARMLDPKELPRSRFEIVRVEEGVVSRWPAGEFFSERDDERHAEDPPERVFVGKDGR